MRNEEVVKEAWWKRSVGRSSPRHLEATPMAAAGWQGFSAKD